MSPPALLSRLWREAKRRRVPQVVSGYVCLAWLTIEATPNVLGNLGATPAATSDVGSALTIFWIAAFPLALTITWMYQVVRDPSEEQEDAPTSWRRRRLPLGITLALVAVGCIFLAATLWPPAPVLAGPAHPEVEDGSLAFLPPELVAGDATAERVATSILHRLSDRLAGLPGLSVRSPFRVGTLDGLLPTDSVARLLGVRTLVTSSVEALGDTLRLTLRVVDGATGEQCGTLWLVRPMEPSNGTYEALADTLELQLRPLLAAALPMADPGATPHDPEVQEQIDQAAEAEEAYWNALGAGRVTRALAALDRVDSALVRWIGLDPSVPYPQSRQSWVAQQRVLILLTGNRPAAIRELERAHALADRAVRRFPEDAESLRLRGRSAYLRATLDTAVALDRDGLLRAADADLRRAQARHRNRAEVRRQLALVKKEQGDLEAAYAFATDAYAYDAYLRLAGTLVSELSDLSFQLARDGDAVRWCDEGRRRFPDAWTFSECRLWLMGWGALPADTVRARTLVSETLDRYPLAFRGPFRPQLETLLAAVHAQAGDTAGARQVLELTTLASSPGVRLTAAGAWLLLGREEQAMAELRRYVASVPGRADHLRQLRILEPLRGRPSFEALAGGG